jgi:hypothetical protein
MIRDDLLRLLHQTPGGLTMSSLLSQMGLEGHHAVEVTEGLLLLSPEVTVGEGKWRLAEPGRLGKILAAIEHYANASGRKVFRAAAALADLPAHEHPTQDDLAAALEVSGGRFELLANLMIRRNF